MATYLICIQGPVTSWFLPEYKNTRIPKYTELKVNFEDYLSLVEVSAFCFTLSKLRCSDHPLMLGYGRKVNIKQHERVCPLCIVLTIETEYHFCTECSFNGDLNNTFELNLLAYYLGDKPIVFTFWKWL